MIEHPLRQCPGCETYFRGEHWKKFCDICYKEKRGILGVTTPAAESQHPAIRADREWADEDLGYADPGVALPALAKCKAMLDGDVCGHKYPHSGVPVDTNTPNYNCQHEFHVKHYYLPQCDCGVFQHQFFDSLEVS